MTSWTHFGQGKFELKTKTANIITDDEIKIGEFVLPSNGEYEVAGIQVEALDGVTTIHAEGLNIAYLDKRKKPLVEKEIERINGSDILIIPVGGKDVFDAKQALEAIGQIEPKYIIPMHYEDINDFTKIVGGSQEQLEVFKIAKNQLSDDDQKRVVILSCKK